jgi:hypothetical protein
LFDESDRPEFVSGCVDSCDDNPALKAIVDGDDCDTTVATIKAANTVFACACDGSGPDCEE